MDEVDLLIIKNWNNLEAYPGLNDLAPIVERSPKRIEDRVHRLRKEGFYLVDRADRTVTDPVAGARIRKLNADLKSLRDALKEAQAQAATSDALKALIHDLKDYQPKPAPNWLLPARKIITTGIPSLFLSDWHVGERVEASAVEHINEYNLEIADYRIKRTFGVARDLFLSYGTPRYDGSVLIFGGDIMPGTMHDELRETNEDYTTRLILWTIDRIIPGIVDFKKHFGAVEIYWITGNHGRIRDKWMAKGKAIENWEWLMAQIISRHFAGDKQVRFHISDSSDLAFTLYHWRYRLTHGDQFKGGGGISGFETPLALGEQRKARRQNRLNKPFDCLLSAHVHLSDFKSSRIVNGTLKGLDEFAYERNYDFEPPCQWAWIVHHEFPSILSRQIFCDAGRK